MNQKPISTAFVLRYVYAILAIIVVAVGIAVTLLFLGQQDEITTRNRVQSFHLESVAEAEALAREIRMLRAAIGNTSDSKFANDAGAGGILSVQFGFSGILHSMRSRLVRLSRLQEPYDGLAFARTLKRLVDRFDDIEQALHNMEITRATSTALMVLGLTVDQYVRLHRIAADKELRELADRQNQRPQYLSILAISIGFGILAVSYLIYFLRRSLAKQKKTEVALTESESRLMQTQKLEALGRLVGGVAHEFNNQLTAILGQAELLHDTAAGDKDIELGLSEIKEAGLHAASLTRQLLAFSQQQRVEARILNLNIALQDWDDTIRRIIGDDVTLTCNYADDPCAIEVDPDQLRQVILNLISNAHDAVPLGGLISISTENVTVGEDVPGVPGGEYVRLTVSDSGAGIEDFTRERMFEPFYTTKDQGKGMGLGLSTVHGIVASANGHIVVESQLGVGTRFYVYFPRAAGRPEPISNQELQTERQEGSETVLIVDDDIKVRRFVETGLTSLGYRVLTASGGAAGLEICRTEPGAIDVILSDIVMAEVSGPTFMASAIVLRPAAVAIYMSSYSEDAVLGLRRGEKGADIPLITKPFDLKSLSRLIRTCLESRRVETETDRTSDVVRASHS